ncbi:MAG: DCC1-like thiol-disulfide oxidoreductase family protein [Paracoccaceae bacterium]|nr:DCC1-like thiol-disulfide oxidoreductase family protein [Paracoccaceae bacterium]MDE2676126.1 DCC1-like thiol-disulfide oxidoreductase family protein [Paracoccaceae bacterium]
MNRLVVLDGDCALCNRVAHYIDRHDPSGTIRIATTGREVGKALLEGQGLDPDDPPTWLYLENGRIHDHLDAAIELARQLSGPIRLLVLLQFLPPIWRKWLYRLVAENRYRLFGSASLCSTPSESLRSRIVGDSP